jgi:hypothetical protein
VQHDLQHMASRLGSPAKSSSSTHVKARKPIDLAKYSTEALFDFRYDPKLHGHHPDKEVTGLWLYVGPSKLVWRYRRQTMKAGVRRMAFKTLGEYPEMEAKAARTAAIVFAGQHIEGRAAPGKRDAVTFEQAWQPYLARLLAKATKAGKPARHHYNAVKLGETVILPMWGKWTLHAMAQAPEEVEHWHAKITRTHGPVSANRACELIRAAYNHRASRDVSLSMDRLPTSSVQWNAETPSQHALAPADFKKWRACWDDIESPVQRGYFLFNLLAGTRPGEGARIRRQDINRKARTFTIANSKSGKDLVLPMTREIEFAVDMALNAAPQTIVQRGLRGMKRGQTRVVERPHHDAGLVFPGCRRMPARVALPVSGQALRHTVRTIHAEIGVSDMLSSLLLGHALQGVNQRYTAELIIIQGKALRKAQERVSKHVFNLLGLKL